MPELPEVETIKRDLDSVLIGKKITDVIFLWPGILKDLGPNTFKKYIVGTNFVSVERRAKNLNIKLSNDWNLLFHMKMTGHLIFTENCWKVDENGRWIAHKGKDSPLYDPLNQFIRMIFYLDDGRILAFSDLRKFAYVKLLTDAELDKAFKEYGPEPFSKEFTIDYLRDIFSKKNIAIKKVLMDQKQIAGIGNIYADEILWESRVHPLRVASSITPDEISIIHKSTITILKKAVRLRGTSTSDFRDIAGRKGEFGHELSAYRQTDKPCPRDKTPIKRISLGGRGTHFCPTCQKEGGGK